MTYLESCIDSYSFTILGDFNYHLELATNTETGRLLDNLAAFGFCQLVKESTHQAGHTLDGIFYNNADINVTRGSALPWSDHKAVYFKFRTSMPSHQTQNVAVKAKIRRWNKVQTNELDMTLSQQPLLSGKGNNEAVSAFNNWLLSAADVVAPEKSVTAKRSKPTAPWYTAQLKGLKVSCRRAERLWRQDYNSDNKITYNRALQQYKDAIIATKKLFYTTRIEEAGNSTKELFKTITLLSKPLQPDIFQPDQDMCNKLATYFQNKVQLIYDDLLKTRTDTDKVNQLFFEAGTVHSSLASFPATTSKEVCELLVSMKSGSPKDLCPPTIMHLAARSTNVFN